MNNNDVPIIGRKKTSTIVVEMTPTTTPGSFDINVNTEQFPEGIALAAQCLLQAVIFLLPKAFQGIAEAAIQELLNTQKEQRNRRDE